MGQKGTYIRPAEGSWRHDRGAAAPTAFDMGRESYLKGESYDPEMFMQDWEQHAFCRGFWQEHEDREFVLPYYTSLKNWGGNDGSS